MKPFLSPKNVNFLGGHADYPRKCPWKKTHSSHNFPLKCSSYRYCKPLTSKLKLIKINRISDCLFDSLLKDQANSWTYMVLVYRVASHRSWEWICIVITITINICAYNTATSSIMTRWWAKIRAYHLPTDYCIN